jgi:hypothetical protein
MRVSAILIPLDEISELISFLEPDFVSAVDELPLFRGTARASTSAWRTRTRSRRSTRSPTR